MLNRIRKFIPQSWLGYYHRLLALSANYYYGRPSEKMIIIGVTGTNGKSTTVSLIAKILEAAGHKVGATSTAIFKIADREWLNDKKMTMLGRFQLQKMLSEMVKAGCRYAVIETSSQGIEQFRHLGIHYDVGVFTNLTPEHLEAHGGFENYKQAKLKLFRQLEAQKHKSTKAQKHIKKVIIANGDDEHAGDFLDFKVDEKIIFKIQDTRNKIQNNIQYSILNIQSLVAQNIELKNDGEKFELNGVNFNLQLFGLFNIYNSLAAIAAAQSQGISLEQCKNALEKVSGVPGRMEFIDEGQSFKVLVDYAPEPESLKQLYRTIKEHQLLPEGNRLIHVLGSCGGGRDVARQPVLGRLAAENADFAIITNEDPYDDDPQAIINRVAEGAEQAGKVLDQNLFKILNRRKAIEFALNLAKNNDLVLLTGKGCEQFICMANGKKIAWDDRQAAREALKHLNS